MEVLRAHGFSAAAFPGVTGTAAADLKQTDRQLEELQRRREEAEAAIAESARERDTLRTYADRLTAEPARECAAAPRDTSGDVGFFEVLGTCHGGADVSALLERLGCAWEAADPAPEEYPEVPVKLKNNCLTRPLNMVTEMYSLPAYDNVDPNPLMAPFFIPFYGVMMADLNFNFFPSITCDLTSLIRNMSIFFKCFRFTFFRYFGCRRFCKHIQNQLHIGHVISKIFFL